MIAVTVSVHLTTTAAIWALLIGYGAAGVAWGADRLGDGPVYSLGEHVGGSVAVLSGVLAVFSAVGLVLTLAGVWA